MKKSNLVKYKRLINDSDSEWDRIKNYVGIVLVTPKDCKTRPCFHILWNNGNKLIHFTPPYKEGQFEIIQ